MLTNSLPVFGLHAPKRRIAESKIILLNVFISPPNPLKGEFCLWKIIIIIID